MEQKSTNASGQSQEPGDGMPGVPMVSLQAVTKVYAQDRQAAVAAVSGVTLDVARGEFVVITGRSGSGKTTLLNLATGLIRPSSGKVLVEGVNLWSLSDEARSLLRNRRIGFVFQFPSLLPELTTLENVLVPTVFGSREAREGAVGRAVGLLETVGLADKVHAYPRQLSKGQQQRAVIARALVNAPELLIADEATSDLDEQTEREIMDLLKQIHGASGTTVLMVTHASELVRYATRALVMTNGALTG